MSGKIAVVQGSFDPITVGHVDIVRRSAAWFDRIFVAVAQNAEKQYMFSPAQRAQLACAALKELENVSVEICDGYVADFAIEKHADVFVRGIRDSGDLEYERIMADFNFQRAGIDTIFLLAAPQYHSVSSTEVRRRLHSGESVSGFVSLKEEKLLRFFRSFPQNKTNF